MRKLSFLLLFFRFFDKSIMQAARVGQGLFADLLIGMFETDAC